MKKRRMLGVVVAALFALNANVFADEVSTEAELNSCISKENVTCTLKSNITLENKLVIEKGKNITLELNGKTLDIASISDNYGVVVKGNLTLNGDGVVKLTGPYGIGTSTSGGTVIVNGGTYESNGDYMFASFGGTITLNDGIFKGNYNVINAFVEYTGTATINGGTYSINKEYDDDYEPFNVLGNTDVKGGMFNKDVADYLVDGKTSKEIDGIYYVGEVNKISVNQPENATVTVAASAITGEVVVVEVETDKGYQLKSITITDADNKKIEVTDNSFVMPNSTVTVDVQIEEILYPILEGENQKVVIEEGKGITFRIDADFSLFDKLYIDGKEVSKDKYTAKSGSTVITLNSDYAKNLSKGEHEIKVTFTDGGSTTTGFTIVSNVNNPDTVDGIVVYFIAALVSVLGLFSIFNYIFFRKAMN